MDYQKKFKKYGPFVILSIILSILGIFLIYQNKALHPDHILNDVKTKFRAEGPIEGSWIEMTKVPWSDLTATEPIEVYYGGLSRFENGLKVHYEFIADAYTGDLIKVYEI